MSVRVYMAAYVDPTASPYPVVIRIIDNHLTMFAGVNSADWKRIEFLIRGLLDKPTAVLLSLTPLNEAP